MAASSEEGQGELNVVPFLDIIVNVLMFVLATVAVTFTTTIDTTPPKVTVRAPVEPKLSLVVLVVRDGFVVSARGQRLGAGCEGPGAGLAVGRTPDGDYDWAALAECARRIKGASPDFADEREVTITAASEVPYETIIHTIDALRSRGDEELFPKVSFAVPR
jgi:biopolymer transport protein ExbD